MPGRKFTQANTKYRYGFNGKENDNDVKGEGNQQDYGMRIYDPRLGRFLSVDPITKNYPELTPYQFASNRPIDGIDMDGLEYLKALPKFNQNSGNWFDDHVAAIDNGVIGIFDIVPTTWNSLVSNYQSVKNGTWTKDVTRDFKQVGNGVKQTLTTAWYHPLETLNDPATLEFAVTLFGASKIPLPGLKVKGDLLKPTTSVEVGAGTLLKQEIISSVTENEALAAKYLKNRPKYSQGQVNKVWESAQDANGKVYDPNTGRELNWDKMTLRRGQWDMGHIGKYKYENELIKLGKGEISEAEFLKNYRDPKNYKPEGVKENRGRTFDPPKQK